jgi:hypothetical protein
MSKNGRVSTGFIWTRKVARESSGSIFSPFGAALSHYTMRTPHDSAIRVSASAQSGKKRGVRLPKAQAP